MGFGDGLVPDYLIRVQAGGFYGWPYAYAGNNPQPGFAAMAPEKVAASIAPDLLFERSLGDDGLRLSDGRACAGRLPGRRHRRAERLLEPLAADRLQGCAGKVRERPAGRLVRQLHDRLLD